MIVNDNVLLSVAHSHPPHTNAISLISIGVLDQLIPYRRIAFVIVHVDSQDRYTIHVIRYLPVVGIVIRSTTVSYHASVTKSVVPNGTKTFEFVATFPNDVGRFLAHEKEDPAAAAKLILILPAIS